MEQILKNQDSEALKSALDSNDADLSTKDMLKFILTTENINIDFLQLVLDEALKDEYIKRVSGYPGEMNSLFFLLSGTGKIDAVKLFLENGANMRYKDEDGSIALNFASMSRQTDTVRLLLKNGANIHHQDKYGRTALIHASENKHKLFLKNFSILANALQVGDEMMMHYNTLSERDNKNRGVW